MPVGVPAAEAPFTSAPSALLAGASGGLPQPASSNAIAASRARARLEVRKTGGRRVFIAIPIPQFIAIHSEKLRMPGAILAAAVISTSVSNSSSVDIALTSGVTVVLTIE